MGDLNEAIEALKRARDAKLAELGAIDRALQEIGGDVSTPSGGSREFQHLGITAAVKQLLTEKGPMNTRELADTMLDRGIKTRSNNYVATVYATLLNNKKAFARTAEGNWELLDEPPDETTR